MFTSSGFNHSQGVYHHPLPIHSKTMNRFANLLISKGMDPENARKTVEVLDNLNDNDPDRANAYLASQLSQEEILGLLKEYVLSEQEGFMRIIAA